MQPPSLWTRLRVLPEAISVVRTLFGVVVVLFRNKLPTNKLYSCCNNYNSNGD